MTHNKDINLILDNLYDAEDIPEMIDLLSGQNMQAVGIVEFTHTFGDVSNFEVSLDKENKDDNTLRDTVHDFILEDIEDDYPIDDINLIVFENDDIRWFLLPIDDNGVQARSAIIRLDQEEFNPESLSRYDIDRDPVMHEETRGFDQGTASSLVKMVNSGVDATEIVDNLDLDSDDEEEVLHFRTFP